MNDLPKRIDLFDEDPDPTERPLPEQLCTNCKDPLEPGDELWLETNTHTGEIRTIAQAERKDAEDWDVCGRSSGWLPFDARCALAHLAAKRKDASP